MRSSDLFVLRACNKKPSVIFVKKMPERVLLLVLGQRGEVENFLALGCALLERGHDIVLATHIEFKDVVRSRGLLFTPLPGESATVEKLYNYSTTPPSRHQ